MSGWQLVERHAGGILVLAGQRGSFSAMWAALELLRRMSDSEPLPARLRGWHPSPRQAGGQRGVEVEVVADGADDLVDLREHGHHALRRRLGRRAR